jgi:hypothetical protein
MARIKIAREALIKVCKCKNFTAAYTTTFWLRKDRTCREARKLLARAFANNNIKWPWKSFPTPPTKRIAPPPPYIHPMSLITAAAKSTTIHYLGTGEVRPELVKLLEKQYGKK